MHSKCKPFLRWAGSKRKLLPKLRIYWNPAYSRYFEPFMGSACLFLDIKPLDALLSDINPDLVNTFIRVRNNPKKVDTYLNLLPIGKEHYYHIRSKNPKSLTPYKRAARFIYLNRFCFNGLYRTNLKGQFNVPYAPLKTGALPTLENLQNVAEALKNIKVHCCDFERSLDYTNEGDFVYMDPPYAVSSRRIFREYHPDTFSICDIDRLANKLIDLDRRGVKFLVSYALCDEALNAFSRWNITRIMTQRNISGFSKHRRRAVELLISNCEPIQS